MRIEGNYKECGIKGAHGFLREYITEQPQFLIRVPPELRRAGVLTEPMSIATKGIDQARVSSASLRRQFNCWVRLNGSGPDGCPDSPPDAKTLEIFRVP